MKIDLAFAYCTDNNSLKIEEFLVKNKYKKNLLISLKKIQKKIKIFKRVEINLSKKHKSKKIFLIKYDEETILGILSNELEQKTMVYNFLDEFYLKYKKEKNNLKDSDIFPWLKKSLLELKKGDRKSIFDTKRSFRRPPKSKSAMKKKKKNEKQKDKKKEKQFLLKVKKKNDFDLNKIIEMESHEENAESKNSFSNSQSINYLENSLKNSDFNKNLNILENKKRGFKEKEEFIIMEEVEGEEKGSSGNSEIKIKNFEKNKKVEIILSDKEEGDSKNNIKSSILDSSKRESLDIIRESVLKKNDNIYIEAKIAVEEIQLKNSSELSLKTLKKNSQKDFSGKIMIDSQTKLSLKNIEKLERNKSEKKYYKKYNKKKKI